MKTKGISLKNKMELKKIKVVTFKNLYKIKGGTSDQTDTSILEGHSHQKCQ